MKLVWMIILILISGGALAQDTSLAVIERDLELLREDVGEIKDRMVTQAQYRTLHSMIDGIKTDVKPKLEKVESLDTWKDGHVRSHDLVEKEKDRSLAFGIGLVTFIFTAVTIGTQIVMAKRNGNNGN